MRDITSPIRDITGKNEYIIQKEELRRLKKASDLGNDFQDYYNQNKLCFDTESCRLIEEISRKFRENHSYITSLKEMNIELSKPMEQINKTIRKEVPQLLEQLENRLRNTL